MYDVLGIGASFPKMIDQRKSCSYLRAGQVNLRRKHLEFIAMMDEARRLPMVAAGVAFDEWGARNKEIRRCEIDLALTLFQCKRLISYSASGILEIVVQRSAETVKPGAFNYAAISERVSPAVRLPPISA